MKSSAKKKKIDQPITTEDKNQNVIEPPKNLLPEYAEAKDEIPETASNSVQDKPADNVSGTEVKEKPVEVEAEIKSAEEKPDSEQKIDLPMIDENTNEVKNDDVVPASEINLSPATPPPPISVPAGQVDLPVSSHQPSNKKYWLAGTAIILAFILAGSWFYFSNNSKQMAKKIQADKTAEPTVVRVEPTSAASQEVKTEKYPIMVLNGSGITGEASKLREILENAGFKVSETGNAEKYDYTDTIIKTKKNVETSYINDLKKLVGKSYLLGNDETLPASDSSDVVVIVGSKKAGK